MPQYIEIMDIDDNICYKLVNLYNNIYSIIITTLINPPIIILKIKCSITYTPQKYTEPNHCSSNSKITWIKK